MTQFSIVKVYTYLLSLLLSIVFFGCSGSSKEQKQNKELEKLAMQVMEVHDRSMPNHGKLFKLKKKLLAIQECYTDSNVLERVNNILIDIEKSDKDMMDWMHNYQAPEEYLPFEEKKAYYLKQKKLIEDIEILMNQTIDQADKLIANNPPKKECKGF